MYTMMIIPQDYMNGIWKKTLERFVYDFKEFCKDEVAANINKDVAETANSFNPGVDEADTEELLGHLLMRSCWYWNRNSQLKKKQEKRKLWEENKKNLQENSQWRV